MWFEKKNQDESLPSSWFLFFKPTSSRVFFFKHTFILVFFLQSTFSSWGFFFQLSTPTFDSNFVSQSPTIARTCLGGHKNTKKKLRAVKTLCSLLHERKIEKPIHLGFFFADFPNVGYWFFFFSLSFDSCLYRSA